MGRKINKYDVLLKNGFCVEQLHEMSEVEMDICYNKILKQ